MNEHTRVVLDGDGDRWSLRNGTLHVSTISSRSWAACHYMTRDFLLALRTAREDAPATDADGDRWFFVEEDDFARMQFKHVRQNWCTRRVVSELLALYEPPIINLCTP